MRSLLGACVLSCAFACMPNFAAARSVEDLGDRLARVYVSEAGWYSRADHAAIYWAIRNRADVRGISFGRQLDRYARGMHASSNRASWVRGLRRDLGKGEDWPSHLEWGSYRGLWGRVMVHAHTDVVFEPPNPCNGMVEHWGGMRIAADRERANRAVNEGRWRRLTCGGEAGTRNAYFSVRRSRSRLLAMLYRVLPSRR